MPTSSEPTTLRDTTTAAVFFCLLFFVLFTFPISDGDCFWHLATGRWIAEHKTLPAGDFLSFTITDHNPFRPESQRIPFLLKQYWLGQLALFGVWQLGGDAGIVLLRAAVYTGILGFLFFWMRQKNKGVLPLAIAMLVGLLLREVPNERPQLFAFAFTPLLLWLLEAAGTSQKPRKAVLTALPLLMLAWSNIHASYLLGDGLIVLATVPRLYGSIMGREKADLPFAAAAVSAILVSLANPTGIMAWKEFFRTDSTYAASIYENLTPWFVAVKLHDWHPAYWLYLLVALATVLRYRRRMEAAHLLTITGLALFSLTGLRYLAFPLLASPLLARYWPEVPWRPRNIAVLSVACAVWVGLTWDGHLLEFKQRNSFPKAAVEFMKKQAPAPQLFNHYDWGGYISLLAPEAKTFMDGRGLVEELSLLQDRTMNGVAWRDTFDRYGINSVIIPGMSETPGTVYPLATMLAAAADWRLVFADDTALVFVRDIPANARITARYRLDDKAFQLHLVKCADRLIGETPKREEYWLTKANALQLLGDRHNALSAYRRVLQLNPRNEWAKRMLAMGGN
jgi:hypothetical protein